MDSLLKAGASMLNSKWQKLHNTYPAALWLAAYRSLGGRPLA